jgi:hypothetical protein
MKNYLLAFFIFSFIHTAVAQKKSFTANSFNNATIVSEEYIGYTFYDKQTNCSINNQICVQDDGRIGTIWDYSPNSVSGSIPPFPNRGAGYNYFDNILWTPDYINSDVYVRIASPNLIESRGGELIIAHEETSFDSSRIIVFHRDTMGVGIWDSIFPFLHPLAGYTKASSSTSLAGHPDVHVIFLGMYPGTTDGQIYYSNSSDGGLTWSPETVNPLIDSIIYPAFGPDNYSIDSRDSIVVIGFGSPMTDVGILKSMDYGTTWIKKIIQQRPNPLPDTINSNGGDIHVLIDNEGMVHAWFSYLRQFDSSGVIIPDYYSDGLEYWNENMASNNYIKIAQTQDFNGNGIIDFPSGITLSSTCFWKNPWGDYGAGQTIMPSAGIGTDGRIFLAYQALTEPPNADTESVFFRHVYVMTLDTPYTSSMWTYPFDIIPTLAQGGFGENQEGMFACISRRVYNNQLHVLYQRDGFVGTSFAPVGSCERERNLGSSSDIILATIDGATVGIQKTNATDFFVSQNYPNPANGLTNIDIGLKRISEVKINVVDILGRNVYNNSILKMEPRNHNIEINTSNWEAGIYNYTVTVGDEKVTRKMIIQH